MFSAHVYSCLCLHVAKRIGHSLHGAWAELARQSVLKESIEATVLSNEFGRLFNGPSRECSCMCIL